MRKRVVIYVGSLDDWENCTRKVVPQARGIDDDEFDQECHDALDILLDNLGEETDD